jgi:hypothetical protein
MYNLPSTLSSAVADLIQSRWPFFKLVRNNVVPDLSYGFPSCSIIIPAVQAIYNSLKGGLDAKSRQLQSILPPIKTEFEQKYKGRLILAIVESAASTTSDLRRRKPIPNARVSKVVS